MESIYTPIIQVYDEQNTYKKLLQRYEAALEAKDINLIKEKKEDAYWKMVVYPLGDFLEGTSARPIFLGNQRVADMINHIILNQPDKDWSGTFKIGGDEFVKIVWKAAENKLYSYIYSFDVNNLGRTNVQWGVRVGDMLLDTMVWLFDELENPDIRARTYQFSLRIIKLCRALGQDKVGGVLFNQLLRSGTSIGANV